MQSLVLWAIDNELEGEAKLAAQDEIRRVGLSAASDLSKGE